MDRVGRTVSMRARGFSLLEVLAAFLILALVGTVLFRLFGASLNNAGAAEDFSRAVGLAESRLASAAAAQPLSEGGDQGVSDDGRFTWMTSVAPYVPADSSPDLLRVSEAATVTLWRVGVTVTWPGTFGNTHSVVLSTIRLASKTPGLTK
jgi:general secretion pathway protein I